MTKTVTTIDGKYAVGAVDLMLPPNDDTREEAPFGVFARVFYPVDKSLGEKLSKPIPWAPRKEYTNNIHMGAAINFAFRRLVKGTVVNLCWHAPLAKDSGNEVFPLVIYSHGYMGTRFSDTSSCQMWASQGYIVFAVEHNLGTYSKHFLRDSTPVFTYHLMPDGNGDMMERHIGHRPLDLKKMGKVDDMYLSGMIITRAHECIAMRKTAQSIAKQSPRSLIDVDFDWSQFRDRINVADSTIVGHSMGGCTAMYTLGLTDRFKVAFAYDALYFPMCDNDCDILKRVAANRRPIVLLTAEKANYETVKDQARSDGHKARILEMTCAWEVVIRHSTHLTFMDVASFGGYFHEKLYGCVSKANFLEILKQLQVEMLGLVDEKGYEELNEKRTCYPSKELRDKLFDHIIVPVKVGK